MKWRSSKNKPYTKHEKVFAWFPIHVGYDEYVWFEKVLRIKQYLSRWSFAYATDYYQIEKEGL